MSRENPTTKLRRRLFSIWADAAQALANGDDISVAEIHREADGIINEAFGEQAKQREERRRRQIAAMLKGRS
jgi:hypothetical protein